MDERRVIVRPSAKRSRAGFYATLVEVGDTNAKIRMDSGAEAWVAMERVTLLPSGRRLRRGVFG